MRCSRTMVLFIAFFSLLVAAQRPVSAAERQHNEVIFNSIPSPLPGNVDSQGPEAFAFRELGDGIGFPQGTGGILTTIEVIMSSWACVSGHWNDVPSPCVTKPRGKKFPEQITMNVYTVDDSDPAQPKAGSKIGSLTQTFQIPYRPSEDLVHCPKGHSWYSKQDDQCYTGLATPITFDFSDQQISLPSQIAIGVAFNTTTAGPEPLGARPCTATAEGCPYDSLNISTHGDVFFNFDDALPVASSVIDPNGIFVNNIGPGECNPAATAPSPGMFLDDTRPDNGEPVIETCWTGYHPEFKISAFCGTGGLPRCPSLIGGSTSPN
jgi:hypothetical protein